MRRFIAGAVCPQCGEIDRLVMETGSGGRERECVHCGYRDELPAESRPAHETPTRVNQPRPGEPALGHETEVQVLRLDEGSKARRR